MKDVESMLLCDCAKRVEQKALTQQSDLSAECLEYMFCLVGLYKWCRNDNINVIVTHVFAYCVRKRVIECVLPKAVRAL